MSYRIVYGPVGEFVCKKKASPGRIRMMTAMFFLIFCLSVKVISPEGSNKLGQVLLPGEKTVTEEAFQVLVEHLRSGDDLGNCIEAFCERVILDEREKLR